MTNPSRARWVLLLLTFVGIAGALTKARALPPPVPTVTPVTPVVGTSGSVPDVTVTTKGAVQWSAPPHATLSIIFYKADYPQGVTQDPIASQYVTDSTQNDYAVVNDPLTYNPINSNVFAGTTATTLTFKYWQVLNGKPYDGHIIINRASLRKTPKQ